MSTGCLLSREVVYLRGTKGNTCSVSEEKYDKRGEEEQLENT